MPFPNAFIDRGYVEQQRKNQFKDFKIDDILAIHKKLEPTARSLAHNSDNDMLEIAATSKSFQHRIVAAWAMGMRHKPDEKLLNLLVDEHDLVVYAAKQSCIEICKNRYGQILDFGPFPNCAQEEKADSRALWEATFNRYEKIIENALNTEKDAEKGADTIKKLTAPKKSVADILEFEKLGLEK